MHVGESANMRQDSCRDIGRTPKVHDTMGDIIPGAISRDLKKVLKDLRRARPVDKQRQLAYTTSEFANPLFPPFLQVTPELPLGDAGTSP